MAVQDYEASVEPTALPGRPYPRFPDQVTPQEEGAAVGQGVENTGQVAQSIFQKTQDQARQTQLTDAHNQLQTLSLGLTHDPQTGAFTKQGKDAFGLGDQYLPQFDTQAAAIVSAVPDPKARAAASMAMLQTRNQLSEQLDTHELNAHRE